MARQDEDGYDFGDDDDRPRKRKRNDDPGDEDDRPRKRQRGNDPGELEWDREDRLKRNRQKRGETARKRLLGPSIGLIAVASAHIILSLGGLVYTLAWQTRGAVITYEAIVSAVLGVIVWIVQLTIVIGAISTMRASSYKYASYTALVSMIPCICSSCAIFGIPFGIWLFILLRENDVKACFRSR
jgi:hypothetical protein